MNHSYEDFTQNITQDTQTTDTTNIDWNNLLGILVESGTDYLFGTGDSGTTVVTTTTPTYQPPQTSSNTIWYILGALLVLVVIILLIKRK
jgi:LPXTG-motif cell wall-anchored protein